MAEYQSKVDEQLQQALHATLGREKEALRLFRPMPHQIPFLKSNARIRILRGGNRAGKTLTSYALTSSCATGLPIWLSDTETLPHRFPTNRPRRIWLVGKGVAHIGQTVYRMLFTEDNGLRVIRDEHTKAWRAWNPNSEYDVAYKEKCKFADPFIPPRFIKKNGFGWEDKRLNHFSQVALRDGSMIYAFTSGGDAKQGDAVDLIHIDEDIEYPEHTMEWFMRLADYKGKMFWSVYPHSNNNALRDFHKMAEEEFGKEDPIAEEFLLRFDQNEFIDKETRDQQLQVLLYAGDATYRARNLGEFTFDTSLVYPSFDQKIHTALIADEKKRDEVDRILRERGGEPPDDWTRYFIIDPGHSVCAGLFLAIPPLELGNYVIAYDEIYQRQSDATKMAEACSLKMAGHSFEDFIMDWHGGRQTPMGMSKTVMMIYRDAFQAHGLRCIVRGSNFMWGDDNVTAGIERVRGWLSLQQNNLPTLRLYLPRTPHLQKEFGLYSMRIRSGECSDDPIAQNNHLCFIAGTQITTETGSIPIESVEIGTKVLTRSGYKPVVASELTDHSAVVWQATLSDGRTITGTGNHPFWVDGYGWKRLDCLRYADSLLTTCGDTSCVPENIQSRLMKSCSTELHTTDIQSQNGVAIECISVAPVVNDYTKRFGNMRTARFQMDATSAASEEYALTGNDNTWPQSTTLHELGTQHQKDSLGIAKTQNALGKICPSFRLSVSIADQITQPKEQCRTNLSSAQITANPLPEENLNATTKNGLAPVAVSSQLTVTPIVGFAPLSVVSVSRIAARSHVFNLTVEDSNEYFANGILVHNCDCLRYSASANLKYIPPRRSLQQINPAYRAYVKEREAGKSSRKHGGNFINLGPGTAVS